MVRARERPIMSKEDKLNDMRTRLKDVKADINKLYDLNCTNITETMCDLLEMRSDIIREFWEATT